MKIMKNSIRKTVVSHFEMIQKECKELKKYSLQFAEAKINRVALAIKDGRSVDVKSEFMTFNEFIYFLNGYYSKSVTKY